MQIQFPSAVTPRQRAILHDIASKHGLSHTSAGEGDNRYIVLSNSRNDSPSEKVCIDPGSWEEFGCCACDMCTMHVQLWTDVFCASHGPIEANYRVKA